MKSFSKDSRSFRLTTIATIAGLALAASTAVWYFNPYRGSHSSINLQQVQEKSKSMDEQVNEFFSNKHKKSYLQGIQHNDFAVVFSHEDSPQSVKNTLEYLGGVALYVGDPKGLEHYANQDIYLLNDNPSEIEKYPGIKGIASFDRNYLESLDTDLERMLITDWEKNTSSVKFPMMTLDQSYSFAYVLNQEKD
ncbi:MAG: hypothetical protein ACLFP2_05980 [Candidatus Woesearchaeota archaeon]